MKMEKKDWHKPLREIIGRVPRVLLVIVGIILCYPLVYLFFWVAGICRQSYEHRETGMGIVYVSAARRRAVNTLKKSLCQRKLADHHRDHYQQRGIRD